MCHEFLYNATPKVHLHRHVVDAIRRNGFFVSCWAPERDHHFSNMIANHAYNKFTKTMLDRCNYNFFTSIINNEDMLRETHLVKPTKSCDEYGSLLQPGFTVKASSKIMCQIGGLARGQYLRVCDVSTRSPVLAVADVFLEVACPDVFLKFWSFAICIAASHLGHGSEILTELV